MKNKTYYFYSFIILSLFVLFSYATIGCSSEKKSNTSKENTSKGDATCAYCGKSYYYKDGYLGKKEGMIGKASHAGWKGGSYCSMRCAENSVFK